MNVKRWLLLGLFLAGGSTLFAAEMENFESLLRQQVARQVVPRRTAQQPVKFSAEKQAQFDKLFDRAMRVMKAQGMQPCALGWALATSLPDQIQYSKEDTDLMGPTAPLSNEEQRAVYYAIETLIPSPYRVGIMKAPEYTRKYPIRNWQKYNQACALAMDLVYQSLESLCDRSENTKQGFMMRSMLK